MVQKKSGWRGWRAKVHGGVGGGREEEKQNGSRMLETWQSFFKAVSSFCPAKLGPGFPVPVSTGNPDSGLEPTCSPRWGCSLRKLPTAHVWDLERWHW